MIEMRVNGFTSGGVTFTHVRPASCVTWIKPSSEPTHSTPRATGDSAMAKIVA